MDFLEQSPVLFTSWSQVTIFVVAIGAVIKWLYPLIRNRGNAGPPASTADAVAAVQRSLDALTVAISATNTALTTLSERLGNVPTKLDLAEQFEKSRHDLRNIIAPLIAGQGS